MPNDTTKTNAGDRLSRYQFRNKEGEEKSAETTDANKPAKPDTASASKDGEAAAKNMDELFQAIVQSNREIREDILQMRMDVKEFKGQTKESFTRLETSVGGFSARLTKLEKRVVDAEERQRRRTPRLTEKPSASYCSVRRNLWNDVRIFRTGREGKT